MKATDDYLVKFDFFLRYPQPRSNKKLATIPGFTSRKWKSYQEMNEWKQEVLLQMALRPEGPWKK